MVGEMRDLVLSKPKGPLFMAPEPPGFEDPDLQSMKTGGPAEPAVPIAADGSEVSMRAGEYAARVAGGLDAKLFAFYVVDEHPDFYGGIHYVRFVERPSLDGRQATGEAWTLAEEAGVECEELEAHAISLGDAGISGLEHALVGSACEEALRPANRTALLVGEHPEGEGPEEGS